MGRRKKGIGHNSQGVAGERLLSFVERIERLEAEKKAIADDIRTVKDEAKATGFDVPTINQIIKDRKLSQDDRDQRDALYDIYRAALGMLHDTPLGEAARRRLSGARKADEENPPEPEKSILPDIDLAAARKMGTEAATAGKPVTDNPFPARDPRRAAWDEAWCAAAGSDGMEIPDAWRRNKPEKPEETKTDEEQGGNNGSDPEEGDRE